MTNPNNYNILIAIITELKNNPKYDGNILNELVSLFNLIPEQTKWDISLIWRENKPGKSPVTLPNVIRYFSNTKKHHIETIKKISEDIEKIDAEKYNNILKTFYVSVGDIKTGENEDHHME